VDRKQYGKKMGHRSGERRFTPIGEPTTWNVFNPHNWCDGDTNTSYDYYVRAACSGDDSPWAGPYTFTTLSECKAPSNVNASPTQSGALLTWQENGSARKWEIEIGEAGFKPSGNASVISDSTSYLWDSGYANTAYEFYVMADCGKGGSQWVGPYTFKTLRDCDSAQNVTADPTKIGALINWTGHNKAISWDIEIVESGSTPSRIPEHSSDSFTFLWEDGEANQSYDLYIRAQCFRDSSSWSGPLTFKTWRDCNPAKNPTALPAENGGVLYWVGHDKALYWDLEIDTSNFYPTGAPKFTSLDSAFEWTEGQANTDYDYYVRAKCKRDSSEWVGPVRFKTLRDCDSAVYLNAIPSKSGALLSWRGHKNALHWEVKLDTLGSNTAPLSIFMVNDTQYVWNQGEPNKSYQYYVRAQCAKDSSAWSGPFVFTTLRDCDPPSGLNALPHKTGALLNWTGHDRAKYWEIEMGSKGFSPKGKPTFTSDSTYYDWKQGQAFTSYAYFVRAQCKGDSSDWAGPLSFNTRKDCNDPDSLTASSFVDSIVLNWKSNGTESKWDLEIVELGRSPTGTPTFEDIQAPFVWKNADEDVVYNYFVRADCGDDNTHTSNWVGPQQVQLEKDLNFLVYPIPARKKLFVVLPTGSEYDIVNASGQLLKKGYLESGTSQIDISYFSTGVYILGVRVGGKIIYRRIVISKS
jgi:hypothetical protein